MPGISAVSPPISAQPACSQPRATAADHLRGDVDVELAAREVVEEEQRLGALHQDVVGAHRHEVDADGVVAVHRERELELGTHAVGAGDEHGLAKSACRSPPARRSRRCPPALGPHRALGERLDALDERVAGVDVDAGVPGRTAGRRWWSRGARREVAARVGVVGRKRSAPVFCRAAAPLEHRRF